MASELLSAICGSSIDPSKPADDGTAFSPRAIGFAAGIASSLTAVWWLWADLTGRLPEPRGE
jgi:hypothetical protein